MGLITKLILLLIPVGLGYLYVQLQKVQPVPLVEDEYWGPKALQGKKEDETIRPFKIDIPQTVLDDLKARLKLELETSSRVAPPLEGIGFEYGFNSKYLKQVGQHWLQKYDWRAREKLLNKFPQFKTKIGGLDVHFYHVKPKAKQGVKTRPLLLLHGWPGSIVEYQKIIPLLSEPKDSKFNYELVVPSLPGYGFSNGASRPGFGTVEMANIFKRLMERLGHKKFYIMGGDWGAGIAADISTIYPDRILGSYATACFAMAFGRDILASTFPSLIVKPEEVKHVEPFGQKFLFLMKEMGYLHIQATKPDTVGVALSHSPIGLAAYILEKFSTWTNRAWESKEDGGLLEKFTLDELLDNVMVYWTSGSITTSARLYSEGFSLSKKHNLDSSQTNVTYGFFIPPNDLTFAPEFVCKARFTNIKRYTIGARGGHFSAFEEPQLVADEALAFFNSI